MIVMLQYRAMSGLQSLFEDFVGTVVPNSYCCSQIFPLQNNFVVQIATEFCLLVTAYSALVRNLSLTGYDFQAGLIFDFIYIS